MANTRGRARGTLAILFGFKHLWLMTHDGDLTATVFTCSEQLQLKSS
jgi:hypothetical protein